MPRRLLHRLRPQWPTPTRFQLTEEGVVAVPSNVYPAGPRMRVSSLTARQSPPDRHPPLPGAPRPGGRRPYRPLPRQQRHRPEPGQGSASLTGPGRPLAKACPWPACMPRTSGLAGRRYPSVPGGALHEVIPEFREIHFGAWEGLTFTEISERYPTTKARFHDLASFPSQQAKVSWT